MLTVSAPGKLILAGEYGVLDGGLAVVAAVARRARATVGGPGREPSPFLDAAADALAADGLADAAAAIATIAVDSSALRDDGGIKLGLGSSAAATVAAIGAALAATGRPVDPRLVHRLAHAAHAAAQAARGAAGSGADVAAAAHGGVIAFRAGAATPLRLPAVTWLPVWTGVPADTVTLVAAVNRARAAHPAAVGAALTRTSAAAEALAAARDAAEVIAAIDQGCAAIAALAQATGVALEPPVVETVRSVVRQVGGAVKTTGAGGGDVAIAVVPAATDVTLLASALIQRGCQPLDLPIDQRGVYIEEGVSYLRA